MSARGDLDVFVDVGKSGLRVEVISSDAVTVHTGPGVSPTQRGDHGALLGAEIAQLLTSADATRAAHVIIGSTSELNASERSSLFGALRPVAGTAVIGVTDDGTLAHARRLNRPGVLLSVGTGVIAIARDPDGGLQRFDGWGPLAGDRGSAVDAGRRALRAAYLAADRRVDSRLRTVVEQRLGGVDLDAARAMLSDERWPATLAALAEDVCRIADADPDAARILDDAARDLADTLGIAMAAAASADVLVIGRFGTAAAMQSRLATAARPHAPRFVHALASDVVRPSDVLVGPYAQWLTIDRPAEVDA